jgi:hypothetical protein
MRKTQVRMSGTIEHNSHTGMMWNIALDGSGNPKLPGTSSCGGPGCRPIVTVNSDGTWSVNQECTLFFSFLPISSQCACDIVTSGLMGFLVFGFFLLFLSVYSLAQASKAILPRDVGGPWGQRIGVTVGGTLSWALRVSAFVTGRVNPSDWLRYSIVVLNCECTVNADSADCR